VTAERPIRRAKGSGPISRAPCPDCGKLIARQCAGTVDRPDGTRHRCHHSARRGSTVCGGRGSHGGNARQVKAKAAERVAEAQAIEVYRAYSPNGGNTPVDVVGELARVVAEIARFKDFLGERVAALSAQEWRHDHPARDRVRAEVALYGQALDRTARVLVDVSRLGLEEQTRAAGGRLERARADRIVAAFEAALAGLGLPAERQREALGRAAFELMHLAADNDLPAQLAAGHGGPGADLRGLAAAAPLGW
jgi:hypothetical protein